MSQEIIRPGHTYATVTDKISSIVLTRKWSLHWLAGFGISFMLVMLLMVAVTYLFVEGIGIWGVNVPVAWGFAIINFVWLIGFVVGGMVSCAIFLFLV